jgi:hypothetical protein
MRHSTAWAHAAVLLAMLGAEARCVLADEPALAVSCTVTDAVTVPICLPVDLDRLAELTGQAGPARSVSVRDVTGGGAVDCPAQVIPLGGTSLLAWLPSAPGTRRFEVLLGGQPTTAADSGALGVEATASTIAIANAGFTVTHARSAHAGAIDTITFPDGTVDRLQMWGDRLVRTGEARFASRDPAPQVDLIDTGPLACTVRSKARFCDDTGAPSEGNAAVEYLYTHFAGCPLVRIEARVSQDWPEDWSQLHLFQRVYKELVWPAWLTGFPVASGDLAGANETHGGADVAVLHDAQHAVGLLGIDARVYDEDLALPGGWGSYFHGPWTTFSGTEARFAGWLYIGPYEGGGAPVRYAEALREAHLDIEIPPLEQRLTAAEQASRAAGPMAGLYLGALVAQARQAARDPTDVRAALAATERVEGAVSDLKGGRDPMAAHEGLVLANDRLLILLGAADEGFPVRTVRPRGPDIDFGPGSGGGLWVLRFRDHEGTVVEVKSSDPCRASVHGRESDLRLRWDGLAIGETADACDVEVRATLAESEDLSHWRIAVENRSEDWGLWEIDFPSLTGLRVDPADGAVAYPRFLGYLETEPLQHESPDLIYPSHAASMQFSCIQSSGGVLYLATYDGDAWYKRFKYRPEAGRSVAYAATHYPPYTSGERFALPYDIVIGAFEGDWIDACGVYREWALQQRWCARGPLAERDDIPQWFRDLGAWFVGAPSEHAVERAAAVGAPVAIQRYKWHQIPFDDDYPDYFPALEEFPGEVRRLHAGGVRVVPYINGRLWDTDTESFASEGARAFCAKDPSQTPYIENWGQQEHSVMCPATPFWREKIAGIVERMVRELDVDGVYIDQVASYYPMRCFDPGHDHAPGTGAMWTPGYRELVELAQRRARAVKPEAILTTEDHAEPFLDLFDGCLTCNSVFAASGLIPMFHHVYSGYGILYGRYSTSPQSDEQALVFRMKNAQMLAWGTQVGWLDDQMLGVREEETAYFSRLARAFVAGREWLLHGRMLRPGRVVGDVPELTGEWHPGQTATMPVIVHSAWESPSGRLGLVFTNIDTQAHAFTCRAPGRAWPRENLAGHEVLFGEGVASISAEAGRLSVSLEPRGVLIAVAE